MEWLDTSCDWSCNKGLCCHRASSVLYLHQLSVKILPLVSQGEVSLAFLFSQWPCAGAAFSPLLRCACTGTYRGAACM
jgi:hypothetical protein